MAALAEARDSLALAGMDPPTQLSEVLLPPLLRQGVPFDMAWELALRSVRWPVSRRDAREWSLMLDATREGWRAAYDGDPATREESAAAGLWAGLARARVA